MSDDRDFGQYKGKYIRDSKYITLQRYIKDVMEMKRSDELKVLIETFGLGTLERILSGQSIVAEEEKDC